MPVSQTFVVGWEEEPESLQKLIMAIHDLFSLMVKDCKDLNFLII